MGRLITTATLETPVRSVLRELLIPEGPESITMTTAGEWWVVHTKARQEKALAADLDCRRIRHFLPLARIKHRYAGRTFYRDIPLFPSYLFLHGSDDERYTTLMTHRAARVIKVSDQARLRRELWDVYRLTVSDQPFNCYPGLRRGRRCRVIGGSLAGLEGVILRRPDVCKVYVGVEALGQSAELEIDPSLLELV